MNMDGGGGGKESTVEHHRDDEIMTIFELGNDTRDSAGSCVNGRTCPDPEHIVCRNVT